jgi:predicted RNase H-like nuclease (RuvC/YqgF family)
MTSIDYKELYEQKCLENETLKEVNQEWTTQSYTIGEILEDKYFKLPGDTQASVHKLLGEISDKQNHIDQLKEENEKLTNNVYDKYFKTPNEIEELKEEITKLKLNLKEIEKDE